MTNDEVEQYQNLDVKVEEQARLILYIFNPLLGKESYLKLDFDEFANFGPKIRIWRTGCNSNGEYNDFEVYPKSYLYMSKEELAAEKKKLDDEQEKLIKKISSIANKAAEKREKRNRDARYRRYLKLKEEFEHEKDSKVTDKPKKESVYVCKYAEHYYDDFVNCVVCHSKNSKLQTCDCKRIYAQQFCPFYEKGELRGRWVIDDIDKQEAEEFKKKFGKEDK